MLKREGAAATVLPMKPETGPALVYAGLTSEQRESGLAQVKAAGAGETVGVHPCGRLVMAIWRACMRRMC